MSLQNLQRVIGTRDTKANIEALTGTLEEQAIGYATDTGELGIYTNGAWVWVPFIADLDDISDVVITSPIDMAPLIYDSGTSKWIDGSIAVHEHIYNEDHSVDCDGSEDTFTTLLTFRDNSICAYLNGVRQLLYTDYNEAAGSVVFVTPPEAGDVLIFDYIVSYNDYASIGALLLETGDYLLTELGDNLLLE